MIFGGFQKLTLLDFPGRVACTLFTVGCNFYCPFCHNPFLVDGQGHEKIDESDVLNYLKKRQGILEGVCITGGEPLMHQSVEDFMKNVKDLGYLIKLDTNGSYPDRLETLVRNGLVDYVAMDIKNSMEKYPVTSGYDKLNIESIRRSIKFLMSSGIDYEFRTTVVSGLHTVDDIREIALEIKGAKRYFIQNFVDSGNVLASGLSPLQPDELVEMKNAASEILLNVKIRGTDV